MDNLRDTLANILHKRFLGLGLHMYHMNLLLFHNGGNEENLYFYLTCTDDMLNLLVGMAKDAKCKLPS